MATERRRIRLGFRLRVLGFVAALLAGAIVGGLFLERAVLLRNLDRDIDAALEQERAELKALATGRDPMTGQPFTGDVAAIFDTFLERSRPDQGEVFVTFIDGAPYRITPTPVPLDQIPELAQRWGSLTEGERGSVSSDAGPLRYLAVPLTYEGQSRGVFVVANLLGRERRAIENALRVEAVVSGLVVLVATVIAWFVAGRLLRPVRELTATAEAIGDSDLTRRIPVEGHDEIARLGRTFNEMLDRLETAFTAQRDFIDDAGHELRTPITIVRGHLDVMGDDPDERRETLALVNDELDRMARIVDDLLLLAKAERPDFLEPEPVELTDLTTELAVKARALGPRSWQLDACAEGVIDADPQRITQAMLNLARNAVDHTVPGAEIGLGSAWEDGAVRLWVRDTGTGIDSVEREHIFERFARVRSGRRSDGAGLGLPIVRSVALAHGGWVELDSSLGQGSTFTIVLPAAPGAARPPGAGPSEDTAETTSPRGSQDGPNPDRRG